MIEVRKQSSNHLENKITLDTPEKGRRHLAMTYYIYSPQNLHFDRDSISIASVKHKFKIHGRYSTPYMDATELTDRDNMESPIYGIENITDDIAAVHRMQGYANYHRKITKSHLEPLIRRTRKNDDTQDETESWLHDFGLITERLRKLDDDLSRSGASKLKLESIRWADETISSDFDKYASVYIKYCVRLDREPDSLIVEKVADERNYRKNRGYLTATGTLEQMALRKSRLKKWSQSVLYLYPRLSRVPGAINGILGSIAAGVAMLFASLAAIFAETVFLRHSMQWIMFGIVTYMFKDRIKDMLKSLFGKMSPSLIADEIEYFISPRDEKKLCRCKTSISFSHAARIKNRVSELRREHSLNPFYTLMPEENVLKFCRYLTLYPSRRSDKKSDLPWNDELALVDRIRMDDWMKEMDDPDKSDSIKIYALNLIIQIDERRKPSGYYYYEIFMDKNGIKRVEKVDISSN